MTTLPITTTTNNVLEIKDIPKMIIIYILYYTIKISEFKHKMTYSRAGSSCPQKIMCQHMEQPTHHDCYHLRKWLQNFCTSYKIRTEYKMFITFLSTKCFWSVTRVLVEVRFILSLLILKVEIFVKFGKSV